MMDDIYSDLENFNDVNIVEELKNENKDLKFKLEEYSGAMHQLQKNILQDFDKLSEEYKKLEKNYSSLLKTARAEIERKTQTIKNLNLEKDTLVINSLQKGKNILPNRRNNFKNTQQIKKDTENTNSCLKEVMKIKKESERSDNQLHINRQPSTETVSSIPTDCQSAHSETRISKTENKISKEGCVIGRDGRDKAHTRENVQDKCVRKVMDRRKSVANFGDCEPTFSSDDDSRKNNLEQNRDLPLAREDDTHSERHSGRHYEQQDYVASESFDYYQPPPSSYRNRGNWHNDFERQRNYESYDSRRYFSPDNHHRYGKEFSENYNQRDHRDKQRIERSPPSDRYNRSKSRDTRHNFERENYRDYGRHSHRNSDHLGAKNKSRFELEEPSSKRPKVDSHSRHTDHSVTKERERVLSERHPLTKPQEHLESSSCQSPDYINIDSNVSHHSAKEIRHTALTPLPDPRFLSNKYILESNSEKPILATVAGCNVEMLPIINAAWGEKKRKSVDKTHPKEADLVSEIYMDIDNFEKSPSLESGEIQSLDEDLYVSNFSNIPDRIQKDAKSSVHKSHQIISHSSAPKEEEKPINKYKIPHLKKQNVTKESSISQEQDVSKKKSNAFVKDFKVIVEGKHLSEKGPETYSSNIDNVNGNNKKPESILQNLLNEKKLNDDAKPTKSQKSNKIVNISTIEGDLELSDETSDIIDVPKEDISNTTKGEKNNPLTKKVDHTSSKKLANLANKSDDKEKKSKDARKSSHSKKEHAKEKTRESSRKRKNKKQTDQEVKEDLSPETKRSKEKGNKLSSSDQKKNKFTDLFGDSNSLITPDDLGLSNAVPDKYVPVFENTQDAVDLSVEDITMVQKSADKINVDEKSNPISDTLITTSENHNTNDNDKSNISTTKMYENTISETNTPNIVKTVIISTGIQPRHTSGDVDEVFPPSNSNGESDVKKNILNTLKANATSTPYKLINPKETTDSTNESLNIIENINKPDLPTNINLKTNPSEDNIESDIPDVRIFVRRRKKATKKPT